jgi:hypothetical protein
MSMAFAVGPNYVWQTNVKTNSQYASVAGLKFAAYTQTYLWMPVALTSFLHLFKAS